MGTMDPLPRPVQHPAAKPAPIKPAERKMSAAGMIVVAFGLLVCLAGALAGFNVVVVGVGILLIGLGWYQRKPLPVKVCPACRSTIPLEATVCAHCQRDV